ncbi:DUF1254 domain-containing protein [Pyxidicoccus parkwayensis]|uniref:DUF1254 domain-containing protein n=1 Tax=Pyxidicoccus parkwayensis TaxID=2813578 RepID=A0ABX7NNP7_9BACT|nr:DUF1254 domain-containing protein [Pyxidicoccus parkwaysis]QSQ19021.1 DUF1254 domain-containing protein [Pyxidicoccus parkwaysis]
MNPQLPTHARLEFENHFPTPDTAKSIYDEQDFHRAVAAYRFFYPTVSAEGICNGNREAGIGDGKGIIALAAGPRHVILTANSDTPYAAAVVDLKVMGPVVVDLPAGPYIAVANDHNQRWIADMGIPGPDAGKGGRYLLLPPVFTGDVPSGYHVARSATYKVLVAVRALPVKGDVDGAMSALRRVKIYPLSNPSAVLPYFDFTKRALDSTPLRWEDNLEYWKRLHSVINEEPTLEEFRPMYGVLATLGVAKGKPFAPDERMRSILEAAARVALDQMRVEGFASQRADRLVWEDRQWEWIGLIPDDANFETKDYLDLQARDRWFVQAIVSSPAMFRRKVGVGSVYFLASRDRTGSYFDGGKSYALTVPQPVPAQMFWSVTAYDSRTRSQVQTSQDKAVLGSLQTKFTPESDGSVRLYFGPNAPLGKEHQWIQTAPGTGFFLYFRIYGPEAASLDGSWRLSDVT